MFIVSGSCSWDGGTLLGRDDQRGTRRQGPRPALGGGVAAPVRARRHGFALHQEGVRVYGGACAERDPVMDEGDAPDAASGLDNRVVGLKGAVLQGVALDDAPGGERAVAA